MFENVCIDTVVHVDAPVRVPSSAVVERLRPTLARLDLRPDLLESVAGISARRIWDGPTPVADAAAAAGRLALERSGVAGERVGVLISCSVSRNYLEPSTASVVHGALGLPDTCLNFDVANACLAFITAMDIAGRMIEHGAVEYALLVDAESSNQILESTLTRLAAPDVTAEQFRAEFASLTLGSGATAMVLGHRSAVPSGHRYRGGVSRAATQFSHLCRGTIDHMVTDTRVLLEEGLRLAAQTYADATREFGWGSDIAHYVLHQVSKVHTDALVGLLRLDPAKVLTIYEEHGNIGPAAVPIVLSKLDNAGRLSPGDRVALLGIGSGLNCTMAEVVW